MTILTIQPNAAAGKDTSIDQAAPTFNEGLRTTFFSGYGLNTGTTLTKGLIQFDLSSIPAGATIYSAIVTLRVASEDSAIDMTFSVRRSLVAWFEGNQNVAVPAGGENASTWNLRNTNGSVAWAGGAGGASSSDYQPSAQQTATFSVTTTGVSVTFDVATDVQGFVNSTFTNLGWWIIASTTTVSSTKYFSSSDDATASNRPQIVVTYFFPIVGSSAGTSTVSGVLKGAGYIDGLAIGSSTANGVIINEALHGSIDGTSTATAALGASGRGAGTSDGTSTAVGRIRAKGKLYGSAAGTSTGLADGTFEGRLRGTSSGSGTAVALGHVYARSLAIVKGCYSDPLLYLTDGSVKLNGQLNLLSLIDPHIGYLLNNWRPAIAQYKEGGIFSDSPHGTGRRLKKRVFANAIEVFDLKARGHDQDNLISYTSELLNWQEAAADYWTSNWNTLPIYLVAKAAKETNLRYAIVYAMSVPELENPYSQPFSSIGKPAHEQITLRLERGDWTSEPPGSYVCVAISSQRSYTVAAWGTGT